MRLTFIFIVPFILCLGFSNCGGGGGGGSSATIEGTLSVGTAQNARVLGPNDGGISGVTVSAFGDSQVTDGNGNFNLSVDGDAFPGGPALLTLSGGGVEGQVSFDNVAGGPGTMALIDLYVSENGGISGTSSDVNGNVLSQVLGAAALGCTANLGFNDGGGGRLWKPHSESTGTVVILMPGEYRNADFSIYNASGDVAATIIRRHCCEHNGGRDHVYISRTASSLAGESLPLTVAYDFGNGRVDCLEVGSPTSRLD